MLPHYRWVRMLERRPGGGIVEMSANRPFGPLDWPTWWVSEMWIEPARHVVRYRHVRGVTTGMDVEWKLRETAAGIDVTIVHEWQRAAVAAHPSPGRGVGDRPGVRPRHREPHARGHQAGRRGGRHDRTP